MVRAADVLDAAGVAVFVAAAALTLWAFSPPGGYFGAVLVLPYVWIALFAAWAMRTAVVAFRRRPLPRGRLVVWAVLVPALVVATAAAVWIELPFRVRYEVSEDAMNRVASEVVRGERDPATIRRIGLWEVDRAERVRGGMRFLVSGTGFLDPIGFAYSPAGPPPVIGEDSYEHLDGPWYLWIESW